MSDENDREEKARRRAEQDGYRLEKSLARDEHGREYDGYKVTRVADTKVIFGGEPHPYFATLDDVEWFLWSGGMNSIEGRAIADVLSRGEHITRPEKFRREPDPGRKPDGA